MVIVVKRKSYTEVIVKILSVVFFIGMIAIYYNHMSSKILSLEDEKVEKIEEEDPLVVKYRNDILNETEIALKLIKTTDIKSVVYNDNILSFICKVDTDLDALKIRYNNLLNLSYENGNIILNVDIKEVLEIKYNEES